MTSRIFLKLILTIVGLLAVAAIVLEQLVTGVTADTLRRSLERQLLEQAQLARLVLEQAPAEEIPTKVENLAQAAAIRVTVIRPDGVVIADSDPEADPSRMENHAARPEFRAVMEEGRPHGVASRTSATTGKETMYLAAPIRAGAVRVAIETQQVEQQSAEIRTSILRAALVALIPTIFLAAWLARRYSSRLSRVIQFARRLAKGEFQAPPPEVEGGELGELGETLSMAAGRLRSMFEQIQDERSRFAAAVNGIGEGILVADRKLRTVLFNPAMERMLPDEQFVAGAPLEEWKHKEIPELFRKVFDDGQPCSVEFSFSNSDERSWRVSCAPIISRKGKVHAVVAVFYDITELERVDRMRKDFVINVSHELRTPLASIQGYAETLMDGAIDDPQLNRQFLKILTQNAERLAQLTSDLMALSQIEVNTRGFELLSHSVERMVAEATDNIRTLAEKKNIAIQVDPIPAGLELICDSSAIHQILTNLLDNAVKYTPEGGSVTVGVRANERDVEFYVRDTGIGIPSEHIPRLFERFYRVDKARSRALGGTGLGLAIVKHLVLAHHGSVRVESAAGAGSTFYFTIPTSIDEARPLVDTRQRVLFQ